MQEKLPLTFAKCKTILETGEDRFFIYPVHYQKNCKGDVRLKRYVKLRLYCFFGKTFIYHGDKQYKTKQKILLRKNLSGIEKGKDGKFIMSFFSHENFRYLIKCFSQKIVIPFEKICLFRAKEIYSRQTCFILLFQDRNSLIFIPSSLRPSKLIIRILFLVLDLSSNVCHPVNKYMSN